jgi:hypothetical protein
MELRFRWHHGQNLIVSERFDREPANRRAN